MQRCKYRRVLSNKCNEMPSTAAARIVLPLFVRSIDQHLFITNADCGALQNCWNHRAPALFAMSGRSEFRLR